MLRKTVTLVFCDVVDSTPLGELLEPEALRDVWSRYHERARAVIERHGGTVEKFVGDAVMAAFGIPAAHEDDALRAVRAAVEVREELALLNDELERDYGVRIGVRTGVNTGEVIAGDASHGQAFATGLPVAVAQRLEAAAAGGEILVGEATMRLVRDAVTAEPLGPLRLKGKAEPVSAWRLLAVDGAAATAPRGFTTPLIGRSTELELLRAELALAQADQACRAVTVLGEPGVGKSRLAAEFVGSVGGEALVLEGRCLPYGQGITYWPLVEIVRQLAGGEQPEAALTALLEAEPGGESVRDRLLEAIGHAPARSRSDELHLAVRRLLETLGRTRPVVVVLDDVQWAEPAFLDLVEYLAGWCRDASVLVCCLARLDLAEARPGWGPGATVRLEPLDRDESRRLLEQHVGPLGPGVAAALGEAAGGNPLFLEEMLRMLVDEGALADAGGRLGTEVDVRSHGIPATVQAVLAARLDRLGSEERAVLERAAVVGERFWWSAVAELTPAEAAAGVSASLHALVRKGLVRPDRQTFGGEDGFRFAHLLVRDTAYEAMPKRLRGELHERLAGWIERRADHAEHDELVAHHLEQAYRYRSGLVADRDADPALAERAATLLAQAGRRALARDDAAAAASLLRRAAALRADDAALLVDLAEAFFAIGRFGDAERANEQAARAAAASGDSRSAVAAELSSALIRLLVRDEGGVGEIARRVEEALPAFEERHDDATLARLLTHLADAYWWRCRIEPMETALERALEHARRAGAERERSRIALRLGLAAVTGPLPVDEGRRRVEELISEATSDSSVRGLLLVVSGLLASMVGEFDEARRRCRDGVATLEELGRTVALASVRTWTAAVELNAGEPAAAEQELRRALAPLEELGERANLPSVAAELAEALHAQGRYEEAVAATESSERAASADDVHAQIAWRVARAKALAGSGKATAAEPFAAAALELARSTDSPLLTADTLLAVAAARLAAGDAAAARRPAEEALELYEAKGDLIAVRRAQLLSEAVAAARTASTRE